MTQEKLPLPQLFKGIALFTPGGDLIYGIDPDKQGRWHLHLCIQLQKILDLPEPPHFLVPCYTATLDRWLDPRSQKVVTVAEAYPTVMKNKALLSAVFDTHEVVWRAAPWAEGICDPLVLATYRDTFPQLWEDHDLILRFDLSSAPKYSTAEVDVSEILEANQGFVLRLFVAGYGAATQRILQSLHELLERSLNFPYSLKVIDVLTNPEQAEADQVSATPTLVRVWPHPVRRIVGDLENVEKLLQVLGANDGFLI